MKFPTRRWSVLIAGVTIFVAAFAIAFAATWPQSSQVVPSALNVQSTVVISGDQMFALWRDEAMTEPVISGDGPHITFLKVETKPPLRQLNFVRTPPIFIQNVSDTLVRPIEPCHEVVIGGQPVGTVSAHLSALGSKEQDRGNTCDDGRIGKMLSPGEKWMMHINLDLKHPLPDGDHSFDLVIGGIGVTGDMPTPIEPPAGMVSWWPGDGNALDIVDGNPGTLQGGAAFAPGKVGQAFSFDGLDDFVVVSDSASLDLTDQFTLDAWINPSGLHSAGPTSGPLISKIGGAAGNNGYQLGIRGNNGEMFCEFNAAEEPWPTNALSVTLPSAIPMGQWSHVACKYDNADLYIYVDGVLVGTQPIGAKSVVNSASNLRIGSNECRPSAIMGHI